MLESSSQHRPSFSTSSLVNLVINIIQLLHHLFFGKSMHQFPRLPCPFRRLFRIICITDMNLHTVNMQHMIVLALHPLRTAELTTGVSYSYNSLQLLPSLVMTSTSLNSKGLVSHTFDKVVLALVHNWQFGRVKRVMREACWRSRVVGNMFVEAGFRTKVTRVTTDW